MRIAPGTEADAEATASLPSVEAITRVVPTASRVLAWIGESVDDAFVENYARIYGRSFLDAMTSSSISGLAYWNLLKQATARRRGELFELLALEDYLCRNPAQVASGFPATVHLDKTLHTLRQNIAISLYERAKELSAHHPLTSVRVLQVAQQYLTVVCAHDHLSRKASLSNFSGRLGVSIILEARFTAVHESRLEEAIGLLEESIEQGNDADSARSYIAEGHMRLADITGARAPLLHAIKIANDVNRAQVRLIESQCWIRLAHQSETGQGKKEFLDKAQRAARLAEPESHVAFINARLLSGLIDQSRDSSFQPRGLILPFGLRRHLRAWMRTDGRASGFIDRLIERYEKSYPELVESSMGSRIFASLLSVRAEVGHLSIDRRRNLLVRAINLRGRLVRGKGGGTPESRLESAVDSVRLYEFGAPQINLVEATLALIELSLADEQWPLPVLILAQTIDRHWPLPTAVQYQIHRQLQQGSSDLISAVRSGDSERLYRLAATRALGSPEVERQTIGGRNGVFHAADYTGLLDEAFVFKPTYKTLAERDARRCRELSAHLGTDPRPKFGVAETIAVLPVVATPTLSSASNPVVAAKRFRAGILLADAITLNPDRRAELVRSAARFLALIQAREASGKAAIELNARGSFSSAKELRKKELGFWMRSGLRCDNAKGLFERWWECVSDLPDLPRRDAHPLNWIVGESGEVIAVDFEAVGRRPLGYELAQLTDDVPFFGSPSESWGIRRSIVKSYRNALERNGVVVSGQDVMRGYRAGLVARAVRLITNPGGVEEHRKHGVLILDWAARESPEACLRDVASELGEVWRARRNASVAPRVTDARRRHLSRAMAYHLRHGEKVNLDARGWAYLAAVSDRLRDDGLQTDKDELRLVAEAIDETRFEVDGGKVRASYGHSRHVVIDRELTAQGTVLFHGTATENLNSILEQGEGLRPMGREWVHLSESISDAERAARRHGGYTLLRFVSGVDSICYAAGGPTNLMAAVPADGIEIVSPASFLFSMAAPLEPVVGARGR